MARLWLMLMAVLLCPRALAVVDTEWHKKLTETDARVEKLEQEWAQRESELHRQLVQQEIADSSTELSRDIDRFIKGLPKSVGPEQHAVVGNLLLAHQRFLIERLAWSKRATQQVFQRYEAAESDQALMVWITFDAVFEYMNWLIGEIARNLESQSKWQVTPDSSVEGFRSDVSQLAGYLSLTLRASAHQMSMLQRELVSQPESMKSELESRIQSHERMIKTGVDSLRQLLPVMESLGLDTGDYNEVIFKTTGDLVEALSSWRAALTVLKGLGNGILRWLNENLGEVFSRIMVFAMVLLAAILASRLVRKMVSKAVHHERSKLSTLVREFLVGITGRVVMVIGVLWALAQVGLDLAPLLAGLGVAGLVVGFALQDTLSNFASGMMILIYRPFDVGDYVEAGGVAGKVFHMSLVNTTIKTFDNQVFMVPNAKIWGDTIKNITAERLRRVDMEFGISYEDDINHAERLLESIVTEHPAVLPTPAHTIKLHRLGESSVDFIVRPWVRTDDYWDVYWDITRAVKARFDEEGISIPYPQRQVHMSPTPEVRTPPPELPSSDDATP
ncbi:mechanosensitive ion channel family protein [Ferrimonas gelatinilytica]|uniref:Small-conductance mechanosensitive channel n=1 Tax=Ferrimonas gelatinilytica TaxID=1255257 RepID=A0ABP9RZE7_9GAMM